MAGPNPENTARLNTLGKVGAGLDVCSDAERPIAPSVSGSAEAIRGGAMSVTVMAIRCAHHSSDMGIASGTSP